MTYAGAERRHHRLIITRNREYHLRDHVCLAVRDSQTGEWQPRHFMVGKKLVGTIAAGMDIRGPVASASIQVGERLCFEDGSVTSPVKAVGRPTLDAVRSYPGDT